jgi:hypothetical protein
MVISSVFPLVLVVTLPQVLDFLALFLEHKSKLTLAHRADEFERVVLRLGLSELQVPSTDLLQKLGHD